MFRICGWKEFNPERVQNQVSASFKSYLADTAHIESQAEYQRILHGARETLEKSNTTSNSYIAPDKDPFQLDSIYRELSCMPFVLNDTRLPEETVLFVIAAEEFINGFSDVILRAFKSNHVIQILNGGTEMAELINYICKYTTKDQQKIECRMALYIRAQKEILAAENGELLSDEPKCRRRLASHMFNMTKKQEIAGPLCALYLERESCPYISHSYKNISIRHVLKYSHEHSDTPLRLKAITNMSKRDNLLHGLSEIDECESERYL
ncbi:Aste57867_2751 [Aphanomyces stellatus]|uniref:Aste57867_2751 protein n=1 Tax=Aphanomyces stellatus TaxID=120398 RepID=A0A485KBZ6_9STRA|nr:hypothetical protein As57867_002744 [Aphanomyces stellatus]VFT79943.1 Aste57867_2751 [Aphanomyces stellatus]